MRKSALFFDIDGTLTNNHTGEIWQGGIVAIHRAQANGHLVFINTGRTLCSIHPEIRALDVDGFLCGCGTCIIYHDQILLHHTIDRARGQELIDQMVSCDIDGVLEGHDDLFFSRESTRFGELEFMRDLYRKMGLGPENADDSEQKNTHRNETVFDKFFIVTDEYSDVPGYFRMIEKDMDIIDRGRGRYEIVPKGFSKSTAIEFVQKAFDIDFEDVYVFGDSGNDLAMFRYAKHSVAMGEHAKELEPYTEFITKNVEDDGIAFAMEHYGLI